MVSLFVVLCFARGERGLVLHLGLFGPHQVLVMLLPCLRVRQNLKRLVDFVKCIFAPSLVWMNLQGASLERKFDLIQSGMLGYLQNLIQRIAGHQGSALHLL